MRLAVAAVLEGALLGEAAARFEVPEDALDAAVDEAHRAAAAAVAPALTRSEAGYDRAVRARLLDADFLRAKRELARHRRHREDQAIERHLGRLRAERAAAVG